MMLPIFQSLWLWILAGAALSVADVDNRFRSQKYDLALEGQFPSQHYSSFGIQGLVLNYLEKSPACDDGLYTILSPRGAAIRHPGPMILDSEGHMVWFKDYKTAYNANVYTYKGEQYLTFWAGNDLVRGHGEGVVYMLNSNYEEVYKIKGANGLKVDLHEFHITLDETAIYTVYQVRQADLSEVGGPAQGWIFDSVFQEIDIETNELLFEWRATDHFTYAESQVDRHSDGDSSRHPWDWFHINSIDKDADGNFLISSRYLNCLAYIHGSSGEVLWQLGGQNNLFDDLSDGAATNMSWQHHAQFQPQYDANNTKAISIFDNSSHGKGAPENPSRGLFVDLDTAKMTASVRAQYWNPIHISSQSQGSMQVLDNGHVLLGYGFDAAWTEFGADGEVLCDVHYGPRVGFGKGGILSYRVFKQKWIGQPLTLPDVALSGTTASVSWNGATEVATWVLQGSSVEFEKEEDTESEADSESNLLSGSPDNTEGDGRLKIFRPPPGHHNGDGIIHARDTDIPNEEFDFISAVPKKGFETKIVIPPYVPYRTLRIVALDRYGAQIGATRAMNWDPDAMNKEVAIFPGDADESSPGARALMFFMGFMTAAVLLGCAWLIWRFFASRIFKVFDNLCRVTRMGRHEWQELDDLDSLSDLDPEARDGDMLLKDDHNGEA